MPGMEERLNAPISSAELERRWALVRAAMTRHGFDVLVMQNNNDFMGGYVKYFTDFPATNGYARTVVFPVDDLMTVVEQGPFDLDRNVEAGDPVRRGIKRVLTTPSYASASYTREYDAELTAKALAPYRRAKIGLVGTASMPYAFVEHLKRGVVADANVEEASDLVDSIRAIKSPEEIERMRLSARMQDAMMKAAFEAVAPGLRDMEVKAAAERVGRSFGSEQGWFMCASGAPGSAAVMAPPHLQNRAIRAGDEFTILIENSGPGGYYTELGRTCVLGRAAEELKSEFEIVREARRRTLDMLKPGASCKEIWEKHNAFMRSRNRPDEKRLFCHSQGYDMVERPLVRFDETMPIEKNMVLACHPTYVTGRTYSWACDNYLIGENGPERLHAFPEAITELS